MPSTEIPPQIQGRILPPTQPPTQPNPGPATPATRAPAPARLLPVAAVLASMSCVQVGAALSVPLFAVLGVAGTTWLRLAVAAVVLLALARPRAMGALDLVAAAGLGVVTAVNTIAFAAAVARVPLGTVVAVEFCGPLTVAALAVRAPRRGALIWPAVALAGVLVVTTPWRIGADGARTWQGLGLAALAATGWAGYIVLTAHVGRRSEGLRGLAVALTSAAVLLAPAGLVEAWPALRVGLRGMPGGQGPVPRPGPAAGTALALVVLVALLVPLAAYALEMAALRRLDQGVFGVWMALEPALGAAAGWLFLGQRPTPVQVPGVVLVVAAGVGAGVGAARASARRAGPGTA